EAQQAMLENAAAQVGLHLPMHEARQRPALRLGLLDEGRPVLGHHLVEHRPLGAPPLVRGRARTMMMRRRRSCVSRRHGDSAIAMVVPPPKCPTSHASFVAEARREVERAAERDPMRLAALPGEVLSKSAWGAANASS